MCTCEFIVDAICVAFEGGGDHTRTRLVVSTRKRARDETGHRDDDDDDDRIAAPVPARAEKIFLLLLLERETTMDYSSDVADPSRLCLSPS